MKNRVLSGLVVCLAFWGCTKETLSITEEAPISETTDLRYSNSESENGEVEFTQTINEDFIAFTREIAGYNSRRYLEVYFQTKNDVECKVWQNYSDGTTARELKSGTLSGRDFDAPELSSFRGFNTGDFRRLYIGLDRTVGWLDIEFYKDGLRIWSLPFFRRPSQPQGSVAFVTSTYTTEAYYQGLGNRNYYNNDGLQPGPFTRPDDYPNSFNLRRDLFDCEHVVISDKFSLKYLSENNIPFEQIDDESMTRWSLISGYKTLVFGQHSEYWTPEMLQNLKRFVDEGGNLLFLGGNSAYRIFEQKRYYKVLTQDVASGEEFEIVRDYLGSFFTEAGYLTFAPYEKLEDHPLMSGVPNTFGLTSISNCENKEGASGDGASGWETDKKINDSFITLAKGTNPGGSGADIVYKEFPSGGKVLNFGSMSLTGAFGDPGVNTIMQNVFDEFEMR